MDLELQNMTINSARKLLDEGSISSKELTQLYLDRIGNTENIIQSYVTIDGEKALKQAETAEEVIKSGKASYLTGIPLQIKDNMCTKDTLTTCSSKMLENFIPPYDATVVKKLREENAVFLGKGNLDEFAMGSSTENSAFNTTKNPWDITKVPGGSSGGPAAAVAASQAIASLGSDTGGSIRQPASLCVVVGLKPTYGLVSRFGLIAFASSLDQIGPITKDVTDCSILLNSIVGNDKNDSTSLKYDSPDYYKNLSDNISNLKIGVPKEYYVSGIDDKVRESVETAIKQLESLGAKVDREVSLPSSELALAVYYIIAPSECSSNLSRFDGVKYGFRYKDGDSMWEELEVTRQLGFGPEVKRRIMLGAYSLSSGYYDEYYLKAQKVRTVIINEFEDTFKKYDLLVTPTSPTTAFGVGERTDNPLQMYLSDVCTVPVNIAGLPAISVPCGFSDGLPIGLQIIGPKFGEQNILNLAYAFEQSTEWHKYNPRIE